MTLTKEQNILRNLIHNDDFARQVLPYIKAEYFEGPDSVIYKHYQDFFLKYNNRPTTEALIIEIDADRRVGEDLTASAIETLNTLKSNDTSDDMEWLLDSTEKFCQDKSLYLAMTKAIAIMDNEDKEKAPKTSIPDLLSEALSVSFDPSIGHEYMEDYQARYDLLSLRHNKFSSDLEMLNKVTNGGVEEKTLNVLLGGTNTGKTLFMCHMAAYDLLAGRDVLYITMEMAEEKIAQRIDANLMNVTLDTLKDIPAPLYKEKIEKIRKKTTGRLFIKEFPTSSAHAGHFRHLLRELKQKKKFSPKVIYIDYINICSSSRMTLAKAGGTYLYVKSIAEELRALAIQEQVVMWSATQTNRGGQSDSDPTLEATSESFGLPQTVDFMLAIVTNEELEKRNQFLIKQLKNRYADKTVFRQFIIGVDRAKMKLYDVTDTAATDTSGNKVIDKSPVFDTTKFGESFKKSSDQSKFSNFKM